MIALDFSFGRVDSSSGTARSAPANNYGVTVDKLTKTMHILRCVSRRIEDKQARSLKIKAGPSSAAAAGPTLVLPDADIVPATSKHERSCAGCNCTPPKYLVPF